MYNLYIYIYIYLICVHIVYRRYIKEKAMGWYMLKDILLISWGSAYYQPNKPLVPWDLDKFDHDLTSRRYNSPKAALYFRLVTY